MHLHFLVMLAKQNSVMNGRTCHRHELAPLPLYNGHTTTSPYISDHKQRGQKKKRNNDSQTRSPCLDKAVHVHGAGHLPGLRSHR